MAKFSNLRQRLKGAGSAVVFAGFGVVFLLVAIGSVFLGYNPVAETKPTSNTSREQTSVSVSGVSISGKVGIPTVVAHTPPPVSKSAPASNNQPSGISNGPVTVRNSQAHLEPYKAGQIPKLPANAYFTYFLDYGKLLTPSQQDALATKLANFSKRSTSEIFVLTLPTTGGRDILEFGSQIFADWKIGDAKAHNGVLFVVSVKERATGILTGRGAEAELPDLLASQIQSRHFTPAMRAGNANKALNDTVDAVIAVFDGKYVRPQTSHSSQSSSQSSSSYWARWTEWLLPGLIFVIFSLGALFNRKQMRTKAINLARERGVYPENGSKRDKWAAIAPILAELAAQAARVNRRNGRRGRRDDDDFGGGFGGFGNGGGGRSGGGGSTGGGGARGGW